MTHTPLFLRSLATSAAVAIGLLALGGCAGMTQQEKNTAVGAAVGGVAGNLLCGGLACTATGAAVGGVIGNQINK